MTIRNIQWIRSVGFNHIIEDALSIIQNKRIDEARRHLVIKDLSSIFKQVLHGHVITHSKTFFVNSIESDASETYSIFKALLEPSLNERWIEHIVAVNSALSTVQNGQETVCIEHQPMAEHLLQNLLHAISRPMAIN